MINKNTISIITAVYNSERFLRKTVESVASQAVLPYEHILVDDFSTDGSLSLARQLEQEYEHVRVIQHEMNKGYPSALNTGIAASKSEYVGILDSDDIAMPHWLESVITVISENKQYVAVGGGCELITENGELTGCVRYCAPMGDVTEGIRRNEYLILHPGSLFRRESLVAIGGYTEELKSAEDKDIFLGLTTIGRLYNVGAPLIWYRRGRNSESRKTEEYALLVSSYLTDKAKLLKGGISVKNANSLLRPRSIALKKVKRLRVNDTDSYEYEMALAFEEGRRINTAIKWYLKVIKSRNTQLRRHAISGILRCLLPKSIIQISRRLRNLT